MLEKRQAANAREKPQRSRRTVYRQIDGRLLKMIEALIEELRARRESEHRQIGWDDVKVGGTD